MLKRTHNCGELTAKNLGNEVVLQGWVNKRRDHGGLVFIDLRDRYGVTQVVFNSEKDEQAHKLAEDIKGEYVLLVQGIVEKRPPGMENKRIITGEIEVSAKKIKILSVAKTPPFLLDGDKEINEELRLKYRFLDLRRDKLQRNLFLRHQLTMSMRRFFDKKGFLEIETPMLIKSTPEGARDYVVPSRVNKGHFYALPQSPQIFKQLLMIGGLDRYFQIVRCFRDEDLRADRQPEFTQLDLEMSFVDPDEIMLMMEEMFKSVYLEVKGVKIETPFPRMSYEEALERFGIDKPDTRFALELTDITSLVAESKFKIFSEIVKKKGIVKALNIRGGENFSRKDLDELTVLVKGYGGEGLVSIKVSQEGWQGGVGKFFEKNKQKEINDRLSAKVGDLILAVAGPREIVNISLANLRLFLGKKLGLIDEKKNHFLWVTSFPLFEYDQKEKRYVSSHHPFTSPREEDAELLEKDPLRVLANSYDLVLNGVELGSGSIRIFDKNIQARVFKILGLSSEQLRKRFGFFLDALEYGTPPHGGIALGLDRIVALMCGEKSIREVIAFPKTQKAVCLMSGAPTSLDKEQLEELALEIKKKGRGVRGN